MSARHAAWTIGACAALPASACASDMSGLGAVMIGIPTMIVAILVLAVLALRGRVGRVASGLAWLVFVVAGAIGLLLVHDSLALFPRFVDVGVAFYVLFALMIACFVVVLVKRMKSESDPPAP